jgi:hypothetical protein
MSKSMLQHLRSQLAAEGIESPDEVRVSEPTELSLACVGCVAGGFDDEATVIGFGQYFHQRTGPYEQTIYSQQIGQSIGSVSNQ